MPEALAPEAGHAGSLARFIVDDYSYCEICATASTNACASCKIAFFCSNECKTIATQRGHAAACRFNQRSTLECLKTDDRTLLSGDGRVGASMLHTSTGRHRGSVAKDVYFALESSFNRRPIMAQASTIGFVIVDVPGGGTQTGRIGIVGNPVRDIMNLACEHSKDANEANGRRIRAFQVLSKLKMLAAELVREAYGTEVGTPKHTYVLCTPVSLMAFDKSRDVGEKYDKHDKSWFVQVDTIEMEAGAGMLRHEPVEIAYLGAPSTLAKARVLSLLSAGEVPVSRDDPKDTRLDVEPPFHANMPFGARRVATNRVIKQALGAEVNH